MTSALISKSHKFQNTHIITFIILISFTLLFSGCIKRFDTVVKKFPLIRKSFTEKWCVALSPFTASPSEVESFTPKEAQALTLSFCYALKESGFAKEANIGPVKLCEKRVLLISLQVRKRVVEKKYALLIPHICLFGIPTIMGRPTTREQCEIEIEAKVKIKGEKEILGIFSEKYNYKEANNLYKSSEASPVQHQIIPLTYIFGKLIESIEEELSGRIQPKEDITIPRGNISRSKNSEEKNYNQPVIPKIPGTPNMINPTEPIPWDYIF